MIRLLAHLASTRLTLLGFGLLGLSLVARQFSVNYASWLVIAVLAALTLNLAAALIVTPRLRHEIGLLVFHISLLLLLILCGIGQLTHFDGHVEVMEGNQFSDEDVVADSKGLLHPPWLREVTFQQGTFSIDYAPGVKRARTRSEILTYANAEVASRIVGDDEPYVDRGFRFYTTHNKGIAVVLTWLPVRGEALSGAVHMPGYPGFDWKQDNRWQPPNGPDIRFWLHLSTPLRDDRAWTLKSDDVSGVLVANVQGKRIELRRGETTNVDGGALRFDELRGWMGYRIFFDPTLPWIFGVAIAAVLGLAIQFWRHPDIRAYERTAVPIIGTQIS